MPGMGDFSGMDLGRLQALYQQLQGSGGFQAAKESVPAASPLAGIPAAVGAPAVAGSPAAAVALPVAASLALGGSSSPKVEIFNWLKTNFPGADPEDLSKISDTAKDYPSARLAAINMGYLESMTSELRYSPRYAPRTMINVPEPATAESITQVPGVATP